MKDTLLPYMIKTDEWNGPMVCLTQEFFGLSAREQRKVLKRSKIDLEKSIKRAKETKMTTERLDAIKKEMREFAENNPAIYKNIPLGFNLCPDTPYSLGSYVYNLDDLRNGLEILRDRSIN